MYNIKLEKYVPQPKPATPDRIVAAHYYPAWKEGAAGLHNGFYDLKNFPERTPLLGYYDGDSPEACDWEIKWALEHGINCFIFCWYRKKNNFGKPLTVSDLRLGETLHDGFLNAKYSDMMNFAIMFEAQNNWGGTNEQDLTENLMPFWIENYFSRDNYLKINGSPVVFFYDADDQIKNAFRDAEHQKRTFDKCREMAKAAGFSGLIFSIERFSIEYRGEEVMAVNEYCERGYDFTFAYSWKVKNENLTNAIVVSEQIRKNAMHLNTNPYTFSPTVSAMWDPSPRFYSMPDRFTFARHSPLWKLSPEEFRYLLHEMVRLTDSLPADSIGRRLLMLDNWNEWDEGHYIMPSHEFGFGYVQAVREELTARDNLPDYRTPQDICPSGNINKEWKVPDFSEPSNSKFDNT